MAGSLGDLLRKPAPDDDNEPDGDREIDLDPTPDLQNPGVVVKLSDGSVEITIGGQPQNAKPLTDTKFSANLAEHLSEGELGTLANDLLEGIEADIQSRQEWLDERAECIKLMALKIEKPSTSAAGSAGGIDNTSRTRSTIILEAALRFQANASGELLPADGPCKVSGADGGDIEDDKQAQLLQDDMNYFLTEVATEYRPDTERMLLWTAAGGVGIKKVYRCPIRRRPTSESVDAMYLIVSNNATDLQNAERVTHQVSMRQNVMKRMKVMKVYRDIELSTPSLPMKTAPEDERDAIVGIHDSQRPEDAPFTLYECYCNIDVPGDEHREGKEISGLPRPYKVTIEKDSRVILDIRRNWRSDDELERPRVTFVKFPFVPGFGFYDLGLVHIAGNPTVAATALLRIMIDAGIFGNFPGFLVAKQENKQNTTDLNVPPGGGAPIDVSMCDGDIRKAVFPLPYKEGGASTMALLQAIETTGGRIAGSADIAVGEGRADAPVGTTIALIEQATKVVDAVHKRMHFAQSQEFKLLVDLFREYPEDFWKFNDKKIKTEPAWEPETLLAALDNYNLVPKADPNTSSQMQRIMRAQAVYQMGKDDPASFNTRAIQIWVLTVLGIRDPDKLMGPPQTAGAPPPDPKAEAAQTSAQAQLLGAQAKLADVQLRAKNNDVENQNRDLDRDADLQIEQMKLQGEQLIHGREMANADADRQHEQGLAGADQQSQEAQATAGLLSDHTMQMREHDHAKEIAAMQPKTPPGGKPKPKGK